MSAALSVVDGFAHHKWREFPLCLSGTAREGDFVSKRNMVLRTPLRTLNTLFSCSTVCGFAQSGAGPHLL